MSTNEFWKITELYGWGTKTKDFKAVKKDLSSKLTPEQAGELREVFATLKGKLYHVVTTYEEENGVSANLGDDSFDDLLSHIIGLGKKEFDEVVKDPSRAIERAHKGQFTESFAYALPFKSDVG